MKEKHISKVFENKVLKSAFISKREEVIGGCMELHNEEFNNFYSSPNIVKLSNIREGNGYIM
jgi:hypothetical protein